MDELTEYLRVIIKNSIRCFGMDAISVLCICAIFSRFCYDSIRSMNRVQLRHPLVILFYSVGSCSKARLFFYNNRAAIRKPKR